ncbi:sno oncogene isoform X2 [Rhodnius prolixus]|uniref:sno oncogene isoform X2 n=1 Tax=Rhodnius prolixus TaxID=13249 RepID=UPI003D18E1B2
METLMGQVFNPHLKKVLKTYQLSAPKSLQGPSTVLQTEVQTKKEPSCEPSPEPFTTPPPLPIQQLPILTAPDRSPSQRCETLLQGERITCFLVGGEKRLCLPQILNSILRDFSLAQINQVCDSLQIFCSRCNPEQLDELKETGILPKSAPSCGLITKTDAERLCSTLLHRAVAAPRELSKNTLGFTVYHECFGKCRGLCLPELYTDCEARCIECLECHGLLSPRQFVCHSHRSPENRTCHWGFDSDNWRAYLLLCRDQPDLETREKLLDLFKQQHLKNASLKQVIESMAGRMEWNRKEIEEEDDVVAAKKLKLDDSYVAPNAAAAAAYLQHYDTAFHYYTWYDPFVRSMSSAFRPWHSLSHIDEKPYSDRSVTSVPAYLSHDPPVLLHPERVVPLSESERFERSYQPNVALAPRSTVLDQRRTEVKMEVVSNEDKKPPVGLSKGHHTIGSYFNPDIELSTDTDDSTSEQHDAVKDSAVEQVAAVFAALSDAKETTRKVVVGLVQKLAGRLDSIEAENRRLLKDNVSLRQQINKARESKCHQRNEEEVQNVGKSRQETVNPPVNNLVIVPPILNNSNNCIATAATTTAIQSSIVNCDETIETTTSSSTTATVEDITPPAKTATTVVQQPSNWDQAIVENIINSLPVVEQHQQQQQSTIVDANNCCSKAQVSSSTLVLVTPSSPSNKINKVDDINTPPSMNNITSNNSNHNNINNDNNLTPPTIVVRSSPVSVITSPSSIKSEPSTQPQSPTS